MKFSWLRFLVPVVVVVVACWTTPAEAEPDQSLLTPPSLTSDVIATGSTTAGAVATPPSAEYDDEAVDVVDTTSICNRKTDLQWLSFKFEEGNDDDDDDEDESYSYETESAERFRNARKVTILIPKFFAICSLFGSSMIVFQLLLHPSNSSAGKSKYGVSSKKLFKKKNAENGSSSGRRGDAAGEGGREETLLRRLRRLKSFHRLLLGVSTFDILSSFGLFFTDWAIPSAPPPSYVKGSDKDCFAMAVYDAFFPYAGGTITTCTIQGALVQIGWLGSVFLTGALSLNCYFTVKHHWKEDRLQRVEYITVPLVLIFVVASTIYLALQQQFNPGTLGFCWIAPNPIFVVLYPDDMRPDYPENSRGSDRWLFNQLVFGTSYMVLVLLLIIYCMISIFFYVRKHTRRKSNSGEFISTTQEKPFNQWEQVVLTKGMRYIGAFVLVYLPPIIGPSLEDERPFLDTIILSLLCSQGILNALVYSPSIDNKENGKDSFLASLWHRLCPLLWKKSFRDVVGPTSIQQNPRECVPNIDAMELGEGAVAATENCNDGSGFAVMENMNEIQPVMAPLSLSSSEAKACSNEVRESISSVVDDKKEDETGSTTNDPSTCNNETSASSNEVLELENSATNVIQAPEASEEQARETVSGGSDDVDDNQACATGRRSSLSEVQRMLQHSLDIVRDSNNSQIDEIIEGSSSVASGGDSIAASSLNSQRLRMIRAVEESLTVARELFGQDRQQDDMQHPPSDANHNRSPPMLPFPASPFPLNMPVGMGGCQAPSASSSVALQLPPLPSPSRQDTPQLPTDPSVNVDYVLEIIDEALAIVSDGVELISAGGDTLSLLSSGSSNRLETALEETIDAVNNMLPSSPRTAQRPARQHDTTTTTHVPRILESTRRVEVSLLSSSNPESTVVEEDQVEIQDQAGRNDNEDEEQNRNQDIS